MVENLNTGDNCCCKPSISGLRMLAFPDGSRVGLTGLDSVMADLQREGKPADEAAALEMISRLEKNNYIADPARKIYQEALLREYRHFCEKKIL